MINIQRHHIYKMNCQELIRTNIEIVDRIKELDNKLVTLENNINLQNKTIFNICQRFSIKIPN